jgi:hypothetical protein
MSSDQLEIRAVPRACWSQHEQIMVYVAGDAPAAKTQLHGRGRHRSNLWTGYRMFGRHPMQRPVALLVDAIRDCSKRGDTVLDPFAGFGTTMIAAERTGPEGSPDRERSPVLRPDSAPVART